MLKENILQAAELPAGPGGVAEVETENTEGVPPRHSFRLDFYKGERAGGKEVPVRGRIEYSLTQESSAFQGLDMSFVHSFIARHLGQRTIPEKAGELGTGKIRILQDGQPASGAVFSRQQALEVALDIDIPPDAAYDAIVYAKSLSDNRQALIGRKRGTGAPILLSVFTGGLAAGLYRFIATAHLEGQEDQVPHSNYSLSSPLFHLFAEAEAGMEVG